MGRMEPMVMDDILAFHHELSVVPQDSGCLTDRFVVVGLQFGVGVVPTKPAGHGDGTILVGAAIFDVGEKWRIEDKGANGCAAKRKKPTIRPHNPHSLWLDVELQGRRFNLPPKLPVPIGHIAVETGRTVEIAYPSEYLVLTLTDGLH